MARRELEFVFTGNAKGASRAFRQVGVESNTLTGRMKGLGGTVARTFGAFAGAYGASQAIRKVATDTVEFDKAMRNVNSIAQLNERQYGRLSKSVLKLAGPTAQAPKVLAEGLYDLVSSGFDSADALKVLRASAKAATAGLTSAEVATGTVAAVLNAYHQNASQAQDVSDVLFRTVDRGVVSFEDLSTSIGDVLPFSASLGVNLREVGASVATMTKAGINAPETMTRIKNTMVSLIKPNVELSAAIKALGFESGESLIKQKGFQGALEALVRSTDGSKQSVAKLFPNIRALGGVLALTGANSKSAAKDLLGMANASGATDKALSQQSKSISFRWEQLKAKVSALSIEFGEKLVPAVSNVLSVLGDDRLSGREKLSRLASELKKVVASATKVIPELLENVVPKVAGVGVVLGGAIARGIAEGFFKSGLLGKVLIGGAVLRVFGGAALVRKGGSLLAATMMGGFSKAMAEGSFFSSIAQQVGRGTGVQGAAWTLGAGRSLATSLMSSMAKAIPLVGAAVGVTDVIGRFVTDGPKAGLQRAGATAGGALVGGILGSLVAPGVGTAVGAGIGASLGGPIENALGKLFGRSDQIDAFARQVKWADEVLANSASKRRALSGRMAGLQQLLQGANRQSRQATNNLRQAENNLSTARRQHGADSVQAQRAELELAKAKERSNRATARSNRLGQLSGPIRDAAKQSYRSALAVQKQAVSTTQEEVRQAKRAYFAAKNRGAGNAELTRKSDAWLEAEKKLGGQHKATAKLLRNMSRDLGPKVAATMNRQADAALKNLKWNEALRRSFGRLPTPIGQVDKSIGNLSQKAPGKLRITKEAAARFGDTTSRKMKSASSATTNAVMPMMGAFTTIAASAKQRAGEIRNLGPAQAKRKGGPVGYRAGGTVPVAVSPGEEIHHGGRAFRVPGRPVAADSVLTRVPVGSSVVTFDGQRKMMEGASLSQAVARQKPHFGAGAPAFREGGIANPQLSGGTPRTLGMGRTGVKRLRSIAGSTLKKLREQQGGILGSLPGNLGKAMALARSFGLTITSTTGGGHAPNSWHYKGRAFDASNSTGPTAQMMAYFKEAAKRWGGRMLELFYDPAGWYIKNGAKVPGAIGGHSDHVHTAMRKGGRVRGFRSGGVIRKITDALMKRGYSAAAAAGIVGNAYRESRWNPGAVGTGGGGLWGFTTSPISLADLKNAAARKGVAWTDIGFQTQFMDRHMPRSLKRRLNALKDPVAAAKLFMDEWERPGVPAFEDRAWGARKAWGQLQDRKHGALKTARRRRRGATRLWNRIRRSGTTVAGRRQARRARRLAAGSVRAAKNYRFPQAAAKGRRASTLTAKGHRSVGRRQRQRARMRGQDRGHDRQPSNRGAGAAGLFKHLPAPIRRLLSAGGLSWQQRRDILDMAVGQAEATEGTGDDRAALNAVIGWEQRRRRRSKQRFDSSTRRLGRKRFSAARIAKDKRRIRVLGKKGKLTDAQRKELKARRENVAAHNRLVSRREGALSGLTESDDAIRSARGSLKDLGGADGSGTGDMAEEIKLLREEISKLNAAMARGAEVDDISLRRALTDLLSGDLAGRAAPPARYGFQPAVNF